ncbi:MAG: hypothetical protein KC619_06380 [Myxococcales bacterium]|nr:hypothetical protein [Myxococcales bacterium]
MRRAAVSAVLLAIFLLACGGPRRIPIAPDTDGGAPEADGALPSVDAGTVDPPLDAGELEACRAVDVLFVIDDSASMADQQASLIASFPGFVQGMREQLSNAPSLHVGIVTSDAYRDNASGCTEIGDLVTQTGGFNASGRDCGPFAGGRFLSDADADLSSRFACSAQVGTGGADDERVARALLNAVSPERNAPGACNAGFVRPDSLLVIVIISDEDDVRDGCSMDSGFGETCDSYGSGGLPDDWFAELSAHRDPASVVVLSLIGRSADNTCGAVVASRLLGFARRFGDNGYVGDVCASSYDGFFREALPVIGNACVNLI